jgi:amidophosphoribosyltransferase
MLFDAGAAEVHLRISSPPIQWPCFYGIDMATRAELIAANKSVDEIRDHVGATSLHYLTLDGLQASTGLPRSQFCRACFDGDYPIAVPEEYAMCKMRFEKGPAAATCES